MKTLHHYHQQPKLSIYRSIEECRPRCVVDGVWAWVWERVTVLSTSLLVVEHHELHQRTFWYFLRYAGRNISPPCLRIFPCCCCCYWIGVTPDKLFGAQW